MTNKYKFLLLLLLTVETNSSCYLSLKNKNKTEVEKKREKKTKIKLVNFFFCFSNLFSFIAIIFLTNKVIAKVSLCGQQEKEEKMKTAYCLVKIFGLTPILYRH